MNVPDRLYELRAEGLPNRKIAERLNAEGYLTGRKNPWDSIAVANRISKDRIRKATAVERFSTGESPQEILKRDPNNKAALLDLADRLQYSETGVYRRKRVKLIYQAYGAGEVAQ